LPAIIKAIVFLAFHGAPADHFGPQAEALKQQGYNVQIYGMGAALKKFQERHIEAIDLLSLQKPGEEGHDVIAQEVAKICSKASFVITDVGHDFAVKLHDALAIHAPEVPRAVYYENLEPLVHGGYSSSFAKVVEKVDLVFFANQTHAQDKIYSEQGKEIDFTGKHRVGIGYYPVTQAKAILERRQNDCNKLRSDFFSKINVIDSGQKILVYFGGNNSEYFSKAFPKFLSFLPGVSKDHIVVIQQHPGAKANNEDGKQLLAWREKYQENLKTEVVLSDFSSDDALALAYAALYYQTSMGPQFVMGGCPVIQIGHEVYNDILVKNGIAPTVTSNDQLLGVLKGLDKQIQDNPRNAELLRGLILKENWSQVLGDAVKAAIEGRR